MLEQLTNLLSEHIDVPDWAGPASIAFVAGGIVGQGLNAGYQFYRKRSTPITSTESDPKKQKTEPVSETVEAKTDSDSAPEAVPTTPESTLSSPASVDIELHGPDSTAEENQDRKTLTTSPSVSPKSSPKPSLKPK